MGWLILLLIAAAGVVTLAFLLLKKRHFLSSGAIAGVIVVGLLLLGGGVVFGLKSFTYSQTVGEAKVVRSYTGDIKAITTDTGLHPRAPWDKILTFDVLANTASFVGDGTKAHDGNVLSGPQVTANDQDNNPANIDVQVTYNLDPKAIEKILTEYGTQESFVSKVIEVGIREETRQVPGAYTTNDVLNKRGTLSADLEERLVERFKPYGVLVTEAAMQEVRYPTAVMERFSAAQAARIEIEKAKAEKEKATIDAEKAVEVARGESEAAIERARGEAEANRLLAASLTEPVLRQRYIDALKAGTTFVVPEGSQPLVSTTPPPSQ